MWRKFEWYKLRGFLMGYRGIDRYEYYFMKTGNGAYPDPKPTEELHDFGAFGSLGSQGFRYIGIVNGMYAFERKSKW